MIGSKKMFSASYLLERSHLRSSPSFSRIRLAFILVFIALSAPNSFSQWTKSIRCPDGHVYRDLRKDAGREEFCEIIEPGNLAVKDGPYKSWYNVGEPGYFGQYSLGREVGQWRECDPFAHCRQHRYPDVDPREKERAGFRQEVPFTFRGGKYVMDFLSCRSTWVTQEGPDPISLNIAGDYRYRCVIAYLPQSVIDHGGKGSYVCFIPFEVGKRELASIDLRKELPLLGLPQFCRDENTHGDALLIDDGASNVASTVDAECATITHDNAGTETLKLRLNRYASDEVRKAASAAAHFDTLLCFEPAANPAILVDNSGRALLTYKIRSISPDGKKQARCVAERFKDLRPCP